MARQPTAKEYTHERLGDTFATALSDYDTQRRVEVLIDDFLAQTPLSGRHVIDVGCGLGFFSARLKDFGADVLATDIGPGLVAKTTQRVGCAGQIADALQLSEQFGQNCFDGLVSSECIEHTPDPKEVVRQMVRIVKPGGFLSISTPNIVWWPVVKLATLCRLRPFTGHENFSSWAGLAQVLESNGAVVERQFGLHLFPFQLPLHTLSTWCDRHLQGVQGLMMNICMLARKVDR
jgi:2-polyprenyl-3-methyl-5-hydroxy-6-metoxy-1,4-benzoquinol methylase